MKRSKNRILTTHTGSLARPSELAQMLLDRDAGKPVDETAFDVAARAAVADVVKRQVDAGLAVINDGEQAKNGFAGYIRDRLHGFEDVEYEPRPVTGDARRFPSWAARRGGVGRRPIGTGTVSWKDFSAVERDIANLKAATAGQPVEEVFMTAVSPGTFVNHNGNRAYVSQREYLFAAADVMKREYDAIVQAGLLLQLDCPDLAASRDTFYAALSDEEFKQIAAENVEALNYATRDIAPEQMRMHVCWGAGEGPHAHDIALRDVIDVILPARPGALSVVGANGRHEHEWKVWRDVKLPAGKVIIPGVIDSTTNIVEHPALVAERIVRYAGVLGKENVMAGVDCGFGTGVSTNPPVDPEVVWAKLQALAEGAALASAELWGR